MNFCTRSGIPQDRMELWVFDTEAHRWCLNLSLKSDNRLIVMLCIWGTAISHQSLHDDCISDLPGTLSFSVQLFELLWPSIWPPRSSYLDYPRLFEWVRVLGWVCSGFAAVLVPIISPVAPVLHFVLNFVIGSWGISEESCCTHSSNDLSGPLQGLWKVWCSKLKTCALPGFSLTR